MIEPSLHTPACPADIGLLLRAHAEQRWLLAEIAPLIEQLRSPDNVPDEQLGAALAYLEVLWVDARRRAALTDTAAELLGEGGPADTLALRARGYHDAVGSLRRELEAHVGLLMHSGGYAGAPSRRAAAS